VLLHAGRRVTQDANANSKGKGRTIVGGDKLMSGQGSGLDLGFEPVLSDVFSGQLPISRPEVRALPGLSGTVRGY
jgi:hypothetical protein